MCILVSIKRFGQKILLKTVATKIVHTTRFDYLCTSTKYERTQAGLCGENRSYAVYSCRVIVRARVSFWMRGDEYEQRSVVAHFRLQFSWLVFGFYFIIFHLLYFIFFLFPFSLLITGLRTENDLEQYQLMLNDGHFALSRLNFTFEDIAVRKLKQVGTPLHG